MLDKELLSILHGADSKAELLAKIGVLKAQYMTRYRRHAIVVIVILSAIITPTGDAITLSVVALPIYILYEISVGVVRRVEKHPRAASDANT